MVHAHRLPAAEIYDKWDWEIVEQVHGLLENYIHDRPSELFFRSIK